MSQPKNTTKQPKRVNNLLFPVILSVGLHSLFLVPFWKFGTIAMTLPEKPMQLVLEMPLDAPEPAAPVVPKRPAPPKPAPVPPRPEEPVEPEPVHEPLPKVEEAPPEVEESQEEIPVEPEPVSRPQPEPIAPALAQTQPAENLRPAAAQAQPVRTETLSTVYLQNVYQRIQRAKRYPRFARDRGMEGRTHLEFVLSRDGKLLESRVVNSSGHSLLDQEALLTLRRAAPFPKLPDTMRAANVVMNVVITFMLQ